MLKMFRTPAILLCLISLTGCQAGLDLSQQQGRQETPPVRYDILIHGGMVVDGTGAPARRADVLVNDGKIVLIGEIEPSEIEVDELIEADGMIVAPGFIDAHSHGNPFSTPGFSNFLAMGVTTITLGQDGSSPGRDDVAGWMERVDQLQPGTNIVLFVGHGTVRRLAGIEMGIDPTDRQVQEMVSLIEEAMDAGCFGLSTGIEYRPGIFAGMRELVAIAEPVGRAGGLVMSHIRSEDDDVVEDSINELLSQGMGGNCGVHISHIKSVYGHGGQRAGEILALLDAARQRGIRITADIYPYNASYTGISIVFPDWSLPPASYSDVVASRREELAEYLRRRVSLRNGPSATLLATDPWKGRTLAQVAEELGKPFEDVLIDDLGPGGASAAYFVMDSELQERLLVDPHIMISTDGSPDMHHPRGYGAFARIIREYVVEREILSLEEAVHKMTGLTASTLGLDKQNRGILTEGFAADIIVFDPADVRDRATFAEPHILATGFEWVIVNGLIALHEGVAAERRSGLMLRH